MTQGLAWQKCGDHIPVEPLGGVAICLVESQQEVATLALVDSLEEQDVLETLLEASKPKPRPRLRQGTEHLHYLLATPFRYPPLRHGSRFGRFDEPSLFYAGRDIETVLAEAAFYRFVFWFDMTEPPPGRRLRTQHTEFAVPIHGERGLCLNKPPCDRYQSHWRNPVDYGQAQALGSALRERGIQGLEYVSARISESRLSDHCTGLNVALFEPESLADDKPLYQEAWLCELREDLVVFSGGSPRRIYRFALAEFLVGSVLPGGA